MSKFKVGDRVRVKPGEYEGYTPGSPYNLPRTLGTVTEANEGFLRVLYGATLSPAVNPDAFEIAGPDSPVREVTRKEVVEGVFGRVRVLPLAGGRVALRFTSSDSAELAGMDRTELSAAIATMTTILDALDEVAA